MPSADPKPGELWQTAGSHPYGVFLGGEIWNVLTEAHGELGLSQVPGLEPLAVSLIQPRRNTFAGHFDALALIAGLNTTWDREVAKYQQEGFARISQR